jgi:uncharacterized membrane protein YfcA
MGDFVSLHHVLIAAFASACCVPLGLLMRSSSEAKVRGPEPAMFALDSVVGFIASLVVKMLWVTALFFVPSLLLLHLVGSEPRTTLDMQLWVFSSLVGTGLGKWARWVRWRRTQDYT